MVAFALTLMPSATTNAGCGSDALCQQLENARNQANSNRQALADIRTKIANVQAKMRALGALIRRLDGQIAQKQAEIEVTQGRILALDAKIKTTEADLARREAQLKAREALFGDRVRSLDKHGSVNYLELLLTSSSFSELLDRVLVMQQVIDSDHRFIDDLRAERAQVQKLRDQLADQRKQQANLLAQQKAAQAQLQQARRDEQDAYAYQARLADQYAAQRRALEAQQARIGGQIAYLAAAYRAELARIAARTGGSPSSFTWPQDSRFITQGFGCSDLLGEPYWPSCPTKHFHTGIDIAGPYGTPIYATAPGVVNDNPGGYGYGNYVIVIHPGGFSSLYGHLSAFAVPSGTAVAQGQVIGYEGSTGFSTGPHLHFEIRYNDVWQNPCAYVGC